jgi:hypothetical protein
MAVARDEAGKWLPGESGNPSGRPKSIFELAELARAHTAAAIKTLAAIMNDKEVAEPARIAAACALLDRGYGKPVMSVAGLIETGARPQPFEHDRLDDVEVARRLAWLLERGVHSAEELGMLTDAETIEVTRDG